ncbi:MAG: YqgE/AlgH family protein [Alphaproteobacteria bacterium]
MPRMGDPRFHKAVIFVCTHDENGAMGLVINQVSPRLEFKSLLEQLKITSDIEFNPAAFPDIPVMNGGPVEQVRGFFSIPAILRKKIPSRSMRIMA